VRRRGATLVEILVGAGLLLLLLGVLFSVLIPAMKTWARSERHSEAQQAALLVSTRVARDYQFANPESVYVRQLPVTLPDGPARQDLLIFLSSLDENGQVAFDDGGDPLWQRRIVVYYDADRKQVRSQEIGLEPATVEPDPLVLDTFTPTPKDRIVARGVRSLAFDLDKPPLLKIHVETRSEGYASAIDTASLPTFSSGIPSAQTPSPSP